VTDLLKILALKRLKYKISRIYKAIINQTNKGYMQIAFAKKKRERKKKGSAGEEKLLSSNCKMNIENPADRVHFGRMYSLGIILNFQPKYFLQYKTRISAPISQTPNTNLSLSTRIPDQKPSFKLSQRQG
jgi:hypothetical protein